MTCQKAFKINTNVLLLLCNQHSSTLDLMYFSLVFGIIFYFKVYLIYYTSFLLTHIHLILEKSVWCMCLLFAFSWAICCSCSLYVHLLALWAFFWLGINISRFRIFHFLLFDNHRGKDENIVKCYGSNIKFKKPELLSVRKQEWGMWYYNHWNHRCFYINKVQTLCMLFQFRTYFPSSWCFVQERSWNTLGISTFLVSLYLVWC